MVEIIENMLDLTATFINTLFMLEVEFNPGQFVPLGKIVVSFVFIAVSLYLILDALGILGDEGE